MNKLLEQLKVYINKGDLISEEDILLVGLSGGLDSVALLCLLHELYKDTKVQLFPIHIHHNIREDAMKDVNLCSDLCKSLDLSLKVVYVDVPLEVTRLSQSEEEVARNLRYQAMRAYLKRLGGQSIAIAHHKEDQAETVLHRLIRGSGSLGLVGMSAKSEDLIRPLLEFSKEDLRAYCEEKNLAYIVDSTNTDVKYTRNKIRHELIPELKNYNPNIIDNLNRLSRIIGEDDSFMREETYKAFKKIKLKSSDDKVELDIDKLKKLHPAIRNRVLRYAIEIVKGDLKNLEYVHVLRLLELCDAQSGKQVPIVKNLVGIREYNLLTICYNKKLSKNLEEYSVSLDRIPIKGYIQNANIGYTLSLIMNTKYKELTKYKDSFKKHENVYTNWFDYDKIKANLVLRSRSPGDWIKINKNGGKKTLKKFFIDEKIPASNRYEIPLLTCGNEIIWIVGIRTNPDYLIDDNTSRILQVELLKEDKNGKY